MPHTRPQPSRSILVLTLFTKLTGFTPRCAFTPTGCCHHEHCARQETTQTNNKSKYNEEEATTRYTIPPPHAPIPSSSSFEIELADNICSTHLIADSNVIANEVRQILQVHSSIHDNAVASSSHHPDTTVHPVSVSLSASASSHYPSASSVFIQTASPTSFPQTTTQSFSFVPFANNPSVTAVSTSASIANNSSTISPTAFGTIFGSIAGVIIVAVIVGLVYRSQLRKANSREGPAGTVRYRPSQIGGPRRVAEKPLDASYPYFKADASMPSSEATSSYPFFKSSEPVSAGSPYSQVLSETSQGGGSGTYLEIDDHEKSQYESSVQSSPKHPTVPEPSYSGIGERRQLAAN